MWNDLRRGNLLGIANPSWTFRTQNWIALTLAKFLENVGMTQLYRLLYVVYGLDFEVFSEEMLE